MWVGDGLRRGNYGAYMWVEKESLRDEHVALFPSLTKHCSMWGEPGNEANEDAEVPLVEPACDLQLE